MDTTQQTHEQPQQDRNPRSAEDFARARAREVDAQLKHLEKQLTDISRQVGTMVDDKGNVVPLASRIEDIAGMTGEIGAHTLPSATEKEAIAKRGMFAKSVHWVDEKLTQAGPYLRAGAAVVAAGGAIYGGVKGAQAAYRWATKPSADAKAMPVGTPVSAS